MVAQYQQTPMVAVADALPVFLVKNVGNVSVKDQKNLMEETLDEAKNPY